jgi:hypothetical protein
MWLYNILCGEKNHAYIVIVLFSFVACEYKSIKT